MQKYEVSVTAELFLEIENDSREEVIKEAYRRLAAMEKEFPTPCGQGRVSIMTYARDKGDLEIREINP